MDLIAQRAETGQLALVIVDEEEATIKRMFNHGKKVELRAENRRYPPLLLEIHRVRVQGKVIGIFRTLG